MRQTEEGEPHRAVDLPAPVGELLTIAAEAGRAIMAVYAGLDSSGEGVGVTRKADKSPLTQADLAAHELIARRLAALTPTVPVVSEEDVASLQHRKAQGAFWLVDPLDGTREFLARNGEFTVNIALVHNGRPLWGVVLAPALGVTYWGGRGLGAWRDDGTGALPVRRAAVHAGGATCLRVLASKSHLNAATAAVIERLGAHELVQTGSSLKFCRIAEGQADLYPRLGPTCEWDTAAAQAVLEGAGGVVHDLQGQSLMYGKPDVLNPHFVAASSVEVARLVTMEA